VGAARQVWLLSSGSRAQCPEEAFQRCAEGVPKPFHTCSGGGSSVRNGFGTLWERLRLDA